MHSIPDSFVSDDATVITKVKMGEFGVEKLTFIAGPGYCNPGKKLARIRDTGNGFIVRFYSHSNVEQDNYICLNYAEADYLRRMLNYIDFESGFTPKNPSNS